MSRRTEKFINDYGWLSDYYHTPKGILRKKTIKIGKKQYWKNVGYQDLIDEVLAAEKRGEEKGWQQGKQRNEVLDKWAMQKAANEIFSIINADIGIGDYGQNQAAPMTKREIYLRKILKYINDLEKLSP